MFYYLHLLWEITSISTFTTKLLDQDPHLNLYHALNPMATVLYYISYLIGPTSDTTQEWIIKPQRVDYHF